MAGTVGGVGGSGVTVVVAAAGRASVRIQLLAERAAAGPVWGSPGRRLSPGIKLRRPAADGDSDLPLPVALGPPAAGPAARSDLSNSNSNLKVSDIATDSGSPASRDRDRWRRAGRRRARTLG